MTRREIQGKLDGRDLHIGIAVATWNQAITDRLLDGALARCDELDVSTITVVRVAGALELPVAALALARSGCHGVVAIGTVIRGDTDHYEIVVREASAGLMRASIDTGTPIGHAVLAVADASQAMDRAGPGADNKGREAVDAVVSAANSLAELGS